MSLVSAFSLFSGIICAMRARAIFLIFLSALSACSRKEAVKPVEQSENDAVKKPVTSASPYADVRSIDFRNFDYPKIPGWMDTEIHLRNGVHKNLFREEGEPADSPWNGEADLDQVIYSYNEHGRPIAFVILAVNGGGTMTVSEIFLYGPGEDKPKLLWSFESGDRADGGLRNLYFESGNWVLELYDEDATDGLCCPSHFDRRFYNWQGGKLVEVRRQEWIPVPKQAIR